MDYLKVNVERWVSRLYEKKRDIQAPNGANTVSKDAQRCMMPSYPQRPSSNPSSVDSMALADVSKVQHVLNH